MPTPNLATAPDESNPEPAYSALRVIALIEESALPAGLKDLAKTYVRRASGRPKHGHPPGYGYTGQETMARALSITPRGLRKRLVRFDAAVAAGLSPVRIRRWPRARHGAGNRGGHSSHGYQVEPAENYVGHRQARAAAKRSGTPVPVGSPTQEELEGRMGPTQEEPQGRLPPDPTGTPVPMICGAPNCEVRGSAQGDEDAKTADGAPRAGAPPPAAARAWLWVQNDPFPPWERVHEPPELLARAARADGESFARYVELAAVYGVQAVPEDTYAELDTNVPS